MLKEQEVFKIVPRLLNKNIIGSKWVFARVLKYRQKKGIHSSKWIHSSHRQRLQGNICFCSKT